MSRPPDNILLPVEIINRELDSRLLLAVELADPSRRIFIGQHDVLDSMVRLMRGGVYVGKNVFKTLFPTNLATYRRLKEHGFTIVHLDEEGGIFSGDEGNWRRVLDLRLDPTVLMEDDFVCTWGDFQKEHYATKNPALASHIRTTGHPRFDIYKPPLRSFFKEESERLKSAYGEFILLNTNVTRANSAFGLGDTFSPQWGYSADSPAERMQSVRSWAHTSKVLANLVALAHQLSLEFPDLAVVLRPHPGESLDFYRTAFNGVDNIHVVHSGPVGPWLMAATVLVHNGCTTAIEAHLAGRPIINYSVPSAGPDTIRTPNLLGASCNSEDEVIAAIKGIQTGSEASLANTLTPVDRALFQNFSEEALVPVTRVVKEEQEANAAEGKTPWIATACLLEAVRLAKDRAKAPIRQLFPTRKAAYRARRRFFYGFRRAEIRKKLDSIDRLTGKRVRLTQVSEHLLVVESVERE